MTTTTRSLGVACLFTVLAFPASAQERRPLEIADLFELRTVAAPAISPDGVARVTASAGRPISVTATSDISRGTTAT